MQAAKSPEEEIAGQSGNCEGSSYALNDSIGDEFSLFPSTPETARTVAFSAWLTPSCHSLEKPSTS